MNELEKLVASGPDAVLLVLNPEAAKKIAVLEAEIAKVREEDERRRSFLESCAMGQLAATTSTHPELSPWRMH